MEQAPICANIGPADREMIPNYAWEGLESRPCVSRGGRFPTDGVLAIDSERESLYGAVAGVIVTKSGISVSSPKGLVRSAILVYSAWSLLNVYVSVFLL